MILHLRVENLDVMPDGGPIEIRAERRGIDIGRDSFRDWCLSDPDQYVSGEHARIVAAEDGYWLHDLSRNGTFLNGASARMKAPHRLADGDGFAIGRYLIRARIEDDPWDEITRILAKDRSETVIEGPGTLHPNIWDVPPAEAIEEEMLLTGGKAPGEVTPAEMLAAFARGAGIERDVIAGSDPERFAEGMGRLLAQTCARLMMLLAARATACRAMGSSSLTQLSRVGNNPLKAMDDPAAALSRMLGPRQDAWLGAEEALVQGLHDLMDHELRLFQAFQAAAADLVGDLAPEQIEAAGGLVKGRRAQLWEAYQARYAELTGSRGEALYETLMQRLGRAYGSTA